jgi:hypothetical protein
MNATAAVSARPAVIQPYTPRMKALRTSAPVRETPAVWYRCIVSSEFMVTFRVSRSFD